MFLLSRTSQAASFMAERTRHGYPPALTSEQTEYLLSTIRDWALANGLAVRPTSSDAATPLAVTAPVTLFPSPFPRECFEEVRSIQTIYNELYASIARDEDWLKGIVEDLSEVDEFIASLWQVHLAVKKEGYTQDLSLGLFRSDYMLHQNPSNPALDLEIKQVEFNTIASSFGGLASKVSSLHSYLLSSHAYPATEPLLTHLSSLPENPSIASLSRGISIAHIEYGPSQSVPPLRLCVLFIVQPDERNVFDQLALSHQLTSHHHIPTFRVPFTSVLYQTHIAYHPTPNRPLIYHPPHSPSTFYEVSVIYFRAGYSPSEYRFPEAWSSRLHLERSSAIKCPSILSHLAGSKKVQQALAMPGSPDLAKFLQHHTETNIQRVRNTFAAIYPLDDSAEGHHAIELATDPAKAIDYVLKPQREGGGNNTYGAKIPLYLATLGADQKRWRSHILMEMIRPPALKNSILRNGQVHSGEVVGELGIFGVCLWTRPGHYSEPVKHPIIANWEAGWLLRTKNKDSEEGGVAAGFGAVDSPCLY